jgi:hypothetical protein
MTDQKSMDGSNGMLFSRLDGNLLMNTYAFLLVTPSVAIIFTLFVWLISHQPTVLFLRTNQPLATRHQYFSLRTN